MKRTEEVTLTNMCMIYKDDGSVLIEHRVDSVWPGVVFPGGHVEKKESIIESVIREVKEETGLIVANLESCGIKQFFSNEDGRYIVFLYKTKDFKGEINSSSEGKIEWVTKEQLLKSNFARGFEDMLPLFSGKYKELIYREENPEWIN